MSMHYHYHTGTLALALALALALTQPPLPSKSNAFKCNRKPTLDNHFIRSIAIRGSDKRCDVSTINQSHVHIEQGLITK